MIIEEGRVFAKDGCIKRDAVQRMLCYPAPAGINRTVPGLIYSSEECIYILNVAVAHDLCYEVDDNTLFFPAFCSRDTPAEALSDPEGFGRHVSYLLKYSYLPDSVLHQLMIRCMRNSLNVKSRWLRGMVLHVWNLHRVFVRMTDDESLKIDVFSTGEQPAHALFWFLCRQIGEINEKLNLQAKEFILDGSNSFGLGSVLMAAQENIPLLNSDGDEFDAKKLLGDVFEPAFSQNLQVTEGSIVIPIRERSYHPCPPNDAQLRVALYQAYNEICPYCGERIQRLRDMQVDHILPQNYTNNVHPELEQYERYLAERGFDLNAPNYIENYFPAHPHCNNFKSARVNEFSLPYWHDIAAAHTPRGLQLMDRYAIEQKGQIAKKAEELIQNAIGDDLSENLTYTRFLENMNHHAEGEILTYLTQEYSYLFAMEENNSKLKAVYESQLQEVIYQFFLLDRGVVMQPQEIGVLESEEGKTESDQSDAGNKEEQNHQEKGESTKKEFYGKPSDLEKATELVLREFVTWLSEERKKQGMHFQIRIPIHRQSAGLQYGYDVGVGTTENQERFNLRFECKHYKTLMNSPEDNKQAILKVDSYSYNLLQYYMHCPKEVNNRWILVSTYGDLQDEFPEKLFEHWDSDRNHDSLRIFAITENSPGITCKDFLATCEEAYNMVYGESPSGQKTKNEVFKWLDETVIGKDRIEETVKQRLRVSTLPLPQGYRCRNMEEPLLHIPTQNNTSALNDIIESLLAIDIPFGLNQRPKKYGAYVIGEIGTGKTWLLCQAIEEIIRKTGQFRFEPFYFELKGILSNTAGKSLTKEEIKEAAQKYVDSKLGAEELKSASMMNASVFFLDGFDETLSGLSFTDNKIELLYSIMNAIRNTIPESLFVVTSRESDYEACTKHKAFGHLIKDFTEVRLKDCAREQVKQNIKQAAEQPEKDAERLEQLLQNESFVSIMCRPVFYGFLSLVAEREEFARNSDERLDEYDVLEAVIDSELKKMSDYEDCKTRLFNYAIDATRNPDAELIVDLGNRRSFTEDTIAQLVPVGIFNILANDGTPQIEFKHNILREYLVAKYLCSLLRKCVTNSNSKYNAQIEFTQVLKSTPTSVAIQKLFVNSINKDKEYGAEMNRCLIEILQMPLVKQNAALATKVLEILLLPGSKLCGANVPLDLTEIHVNTLYLWNCVLENIDMRNSVIAGLQLINAELINLSFQGATIQNLQVCSELQIVGITKWQKGSTWEVVLLLGNGQLLRYTIHDQFDTEHISVKLLEKAEVDSIDGVFYVESDLCLFQNNAIYSQQRGKLYEMHSDRKLLRINSIGNSVYYVAKQDGLTYTLSFKDDSTPACYCFDPKDSISVDSLCFIESDLCAYIQKGKLVLRDGAELGPVCDLFDETTCFSASITGKSIISIYLLSSKRLRVLNVTKAREIMQEKDIPFEQLCKRFRYVEPLNDWVLLATDESKAYLIKILESKCEIVELSAGVKCQGLKLGDGENEKQLQVEKAYELLHSMNS